MHFTLYYVQHNFNYRHWNCLSHPRENNIVTSYNSPRVDVSVSNTWRTLTVWLLNRRDASVNNTWRTLIVWPLNRQSTLRHIESPVDISARLLQMQFAGYARFESGSKMWPTEKSKVAYVSGPWAVGYEGPCCLFPYCELS